MEGLLFLENGTIWRGTGFGAKATRVGELVYNTSMIGYQEVLTDPSYAGQIVNMTYPLIGNYGISLDAYESAKIHACGLVVRNISKTPSHYTSSCDIDQWLESMGVPGVYGVDTREITRKIRSDGTMKCVISNEGISPEKAKALCNSTRLRQDWMKTTGVTKPERLSGKGPLVVILDFGLKNSIIKALSSRGCEICLMPYFSTAKEILSLKPDGILLSDGPGNPEEAKEAIYQVNKLMDGSIPIFGICLGHQIMALAAGGKTYKLKSGHRGSNHGIFDRITGRSYVTYQNHGYAVKAESVVLKGMEITHINLNDSTVEGMKHTHKPQYSIQFHPSSSDAAYLIDYFISHMKGGILNA